MMTDSEIIAHALNMWANFVETGSVHLSAEDLINGGETLDIRDLNESQQNMVRRMRWLASQALGGRMMLIPEDENPETDTTAPRPMSLVRFDHEETCPEDRYPFTPDDSYIFLGEFPNMPGHCAVLGFRDGKLYAGYHTEDFVELTEDET